MIAKRNNASMTDCKSIKNLSPDIQQNAGLTITKQVLLAITY
jgi:hypothetical protein